MLDLQDEELDKAMGFVRRSGSRDVPTVTGLLILGRDESIKRLLPTVGLFFQVLQYGDVRLNEVIDKPMLATFEKVQDYLKAWNPEEELTSGFYRMSVPDFDPRAFHEAVVNAFSHRDYSMLHRVRILIDEDGLSISSPGGFWKGSRLKTC